MFHVQHLKSSKFERRGLRTYFEYRDLGISRWHVSISHIETHATASAIGLRGEA